MPKLTWLCCVPLVVLTSCSAVAVEEPMGGTPLEIEAGEWEGYWRGHVSDADDGVVGSIEVLDSAGGVIRAVWLEDDEPHSTRIYLREANGWTFASIPESDSDFALGPDTDPAAGQVSRYVWARIEKHGDAIFVWQPDVDAFRDLVRAGSLPGDAGPPDSRLSDVVLGPLRPDDYVFISSDEAGTPFEWDSPLVLIRSR
jgi:hypothetical protein